jgi:hypothetical protein
MGDRRRTDVAARPAAAGAREIGACTATHDLAWRAPAIVEAVGTYRAIRVPQCIGTRRGVGAACRVAARAAPGSGIRRLRESGGVVRVCRPARGAPCHEQRQPRCDRNIRDPAKPSPAQRSHLVLISIPRGDSVVRGKLCLRWCF